MILFNHMKTHIYMCIYCISIYDYMRMTYIYIWHMYIYIYIHTYVTYIYIYIMYVCLIYMGIVSLRASSESSPFQSSWTRRSFGGRETITTSMNLITSSETMHYALDRTKPNKDINTSYTFDITTHTHYV